jgi:hypothetical protein
MKLTLIRAENCAELLNQQDSLENICPELEKGIEFKERSGKQIMHTLNFGYEERRRAGDHVWIHYKHPISQAFLTGMIISLRRRKGRVKGGL